MSFDPNGFRDLAKLPSLRHLDTSSLHDTSNIMFDCVASLTRLESLTLNFTLKLDDSRLLKITEALLGLKMLDVSGCEKLSEESFRRIGSSLTSLQHVVLMHCDQVTVRMLSHLEPLEHLARLDVRHTEVGHMLSSSTDDNCSEDGKWLQRLDVLCCTSDQCRVCDLKHSTLNRLTQ